METSSIFIGDLSYFCTEQDLVRLFEPFGEVKSAIIRRGKYGDTLHYAFVKMLSSDAQAAIASMQGTKFMGRPIRVGVNAPNQIRSSNISDIRSQWAQIYVNFQSKSIRTQINEELLSSIFSRLGLVMDCVVKHYVVEMNPHRQQGYAFIYFQHPSDALRAVQKFKQRSIDGIYFDCNACFPEASVADGEVATSRTEDERKNIEEKEDRSSSPYPSVPSGNLSMIPSLSHSSEAPINATSTPISSPYIPTLGSQSPQNLSNAHALQPQPLVVNAGIQGHSYLPVSPSLSQSSSHSFSSYHNRSHLHPSHPPATLSSDIGHAPPGSHANSPQMSTNINNSGHPIKGNQSNNPHALRRSQSQQQNHHHHSHNHHHHHQGFSSTVIAPESPMIQTIAAEPYSLPTATSVPFATYVGPSFVQPALAPVYPTTTVSAAQPYYDAYQHAHLMNSAMMPAISTYGVLVPPQQQSSQQQQLYYQSYQSYPVLSHPPVSHQFLPLPQPHSHQMQPQTLPAPGMRASHPMMVNVNTVNQGNRPDPSQFTADRESRTVAEINNNNLNSSIAYHPPAITLSNSHPSPSALAQFPHQQSASIVPVSTPLANTDQAYPVNHHHPPYNHNHASQSQQLRRSN